jgi:cellulose synthase/poly-beta-1,6-N-acetylglucosamine synthase-like glycosyltransferase
MIVKLIFWICLGIILYAYFGYTLLLLCIAGIRRIFGRSNEIYEYHEPPVTLIIPAYNEERYVIEKIHNSLELDYPKGKLKIIWITDGTTDQTFELLRHYPEMIIMHEHDRKGKIHAMNRGIRATETPIVIFTDANTMLNRQAIREIVQLFVQDKTGCVTGEKRISNTDMQKAAGAGEGLYWRYESLIKRLESETGSVVGAVGEIFAIRTDLYEEVNEDTLLDDFALSLDIIRRGYDVKYAPRAWGTETASLSVEEEMKRKVRIAIGGLQSLTRMTDLLNPFKYGWLSVKYVSHKVLRWTLVPFCIPVVFFTNLALVLSSTYSQAFELIFILQICFYIMVIAGKILENVKTNAGFLFAPYYLFIMNFAIIKGIFRFFSGNYSVKWQKVKRT